MCCAEDTRRCGCICVGSYVDHGMHDGRQLKLSTLIGDEVGGCGVNAR